MPQRKCAKEKAIITNPVKRITLPISLGREQPGPLNTQKPHFHTACHTFLPEDFV